MILVALATFGIGVLPTYEAIGLAAPMLLLLCRLLQGFSTGGEYAGAMTFVTEYTPDRRQGFLASFLEVGTLTGYLLGALVVTILQTTLGEQALLDYGWRIPFLIALPMGMIGLYLRYRLEETPAFTQLSGQEGSEQGQQSFRRFFRVAARYGWRPVLVCFGLVVLSLPSFLLLQSGSTVGVLGGLVLMGLKLVCFNSTMPATLPALFQTSVRYGTLAITFNVAVSVFGGTTSLIVEGLIALTGLLVMPAFYLMAAGLVGMVAVYFLREPARRPLPGSNPAAASDQEARHMAGSA